MRVEIIIFGTSHDPGHSKVVDGLQTHLFCSLKAETEEQDDQTVDNGG